MTPVLNARKQIAVARYLNANPFAVEPVHTTSNKFVNAFVIVERTTRNIVATIPVDFDSDSDTPESDARVIAHKTALDIARYLPK